MKSLCIILFLALSLCATAAPAQQSGLSVFANAYLDSTRTPQTRVSAEIPFRKLVFFKKQGVYEARYEVYLEIWRTDGDKGLAGTYVMQGSATVQTYKDTKKSDTRSRSWRLVSLDPGSYSIEATLRVKDTRISMHRSVELRVPDFVMSGIGFGTPRVLMVPSNRMPSFAKWSEFRNVPTVEKQADVTLAMFDRQPAVRFEIFLDEDTPEPIPCNLFYEVVSATDEQMLYGRKQIHLRGEGDEYVIGFNVDNWEPGVYRLNLRAVAKNPDRDASATVDVRIDVTRAMLTTGFDQTMTIMSIIYSKDELRPLRDANEAQRPVEWARFWHARDPDPETPENEALQSYVARINYVMEHFSRVAPGWKTDRGQVYIKYGAPDEIDRAADQRNRGEYEIWRYHAMNRSFVFYDMFGLGDYKLVEGDMF